MKTWNDVTPISRTNINSERFILVVTYNAEFRSGDLMEIEDKLLEITDIQTNSNETEQTIYASNFP